MSSVVLSGVASSIVASSIVASSIVACAAGAGCYTDRINSAPTAHISVVSGDPNNVRISAGLPPVLSGTTSTDPDGDTLAYEWHVFICPSGGCLPEANDFGDEAHYTFQVDLGYGHVLNRVVLTVKDSSGATDSDFLDIVPINSPPTVAIAEALANLKNRNGHYTVGRELTLDATPRDPDTGDTPTVTWKILAMPSGAHPEEHDLPIISDTIYPHVLRPDLPGTYTVQATADDGFGKTSASTIDLTVEPDLPPCIEAREPDAPIGFPVVVTRAGGARVFRVDSVEDDLDAYPFAANADDRSGQATFQWFTGPEGETPEAVTGQVTSAFTLDPSTLPLGGRVIVRVDARDRVERTCAADSATCASGTNDSCLSRYSWTVEVR